MNIGSLGRLEKLELRKYWRSEAQDFTPWLASDENIALLGEVIGMELEVQGREESVGPFSADILCRDTINDHFVLIENQLEKTDHSHLGQLMTYAAGLDAVTIIWIAQRFTEEHRAALDWLNRITDDTFTFFGIEIELYRIGDSVPAPMFKLVSKPNNWSKQVRKSANTGNASETMVLQQAYWQTLKDYMESKKSHIRMQAPQMQHWTNVAIGRSYFHLSATVNSRDSSISVILNIMGDQAKENYQKLEDIAKERSLASIDPNVVWDVLDGRKSAMVYLKSSGDFTNKLDWPNQFAWFKKQIEAFHDFFKPILKNL